MRIAILSVTPSAILQVTLSAILPVTVSATLLVTLSAILPAILSGALGLPSLGAAEGPLPGRGGIRLTVANPLPFLRRGEAVTCGAPLPKGFALSSGELVLSGPEGKLVPLQVQTTGTYGNAVAPRWVLLSFLADLPAGGSSVYRLATGTGNPSGRRRRSGASSSRRPTGGSSRRTFSMRRPLPLATGRGG
jgi:hypothetical protein